MPLADPTVIQNPERLNALYSLLLLDTPADPAFDRLARLASRLLNAPVSVVTLIDAHRQYMKGFVGVGDPWATQREVPLSHSFCQHVVAHNAPLIVEDARQHPLVHDNAAIRDMDVIAYAGMPLKLADGLPLGALCVVDHQPRHWTGEELEILAELTQSVITEIALRRELIERKRVEEAAHLSEQRLRTILSNAPLILLTIDRDEIVTLVTGKGLRPLKLQTGYLVGQNLFENMNRDDLKQNMRRALAGETVIADVQLGELCYSASYAPLVSRNGEIEGAIMVANDVTERSQAESALQESRRFNEQVIDTVPDIVYIFDVVEARNVYTNREIGHVLGYSPDEIKAMAGDMMVTLLHPDDLARVGAHLARLRDGETGALYEIEYRMRHKDGTWRSLHSREQIFECDEAGKPKRMLGVAQNVTQQRRAEQEQLRYVNRVTMQRRIDFELTRSLDLYAVLEIAMDSAQRITGASDGFVGLLEDDGVRAAYAMGEYKQNVIFPLHTGILGRVIRSLKPELIEEVHHDADYVPRIPHTAAKMIVPLLYRERLIGVLNLETPKRERFTAEAFDFLKLIIGRITIAIENARLYQVSQDQLQELSRIMVRVSELEQLKSDMIRIAAHDLRNPLGVVLGFSQLMLESIDGVEDTSIDSAHRDFVQSIFNGGLKMRRIIEDILSLERIEAMHRGALESTVSVNDLVQTSVDELSPRADAKAQQLTLNMFETPMFVQGDSAQLREAIDNLISNAIKYTPEGGAISVTLMTDGKKVHFSVEDTGIGIPENQQNNLFKPFFRARTEETDRIEGTGLGLHLVKNIVERHGGRMHFRSIYGKGSCFSFELAAVAAPVFVEGEKRHLTPSPSP